MGHFMSSILFRSVLAVALALSFSQSSPAAQVGKAGTGPKVSGPSDEGESAIKRFQVAPGLKVDLWAAEPLLANPVAITVDEKGRWYVAETFRHSDGVPDIRGHMHWLEQELAAKTVADRLAILKGDAKLDFAKLSQETDRVRMVWDSTGSGRADKATVFADGFNDPLQGIGAGLLARKGSVYFTCIPDLWLLRDTKDTGVADVKKSLSTGYGVRTAFIGHDLHGLRIGMDGKLYFTIGDRGASATAVDGSKIATPEMGAAFRCNLDGSELEVFSSGLRNPQELAFDKFGNLWTADNNSDAGDPARWVYLVEGADNGWRVGWQFINQPNARGPWLSERLCYPHFEGQAAYINPPVAILGNGPSGITADTGTGLPAQYRDHFFVANFSGGPGNSGIFSVSVTSKGAGFEMNKPEHLIWNILATDVEIGVDGGAYVSDWVNGWPKPGKGRIYRIHDPAVSASALVRETQKLIADGMDARPVAELAKLLAHADMRVRREAQFALVEKSSEGRAALTAAAKANTNQLARLHGIWGLGQIASATRRSASSADAETVTTLIALLGDNDAEVRAQAAKVLGDARAAAAFDGLVKLLADSSARTRSLAAIALGKLSRKEATPALFQVLREANDKDPALRQAAVIGLAGSGDVAALTAASSDASRAARLGAVVALRRLKNPAVAKFLADADPLVIAEAARAINDETIDAAIPELAALAAKTTQLLGFSEGSKEKPGPRDAILRRVLNANLRAGTPTAAAALAAFAATEQAPEARRLEALQHLADWAEPAKLDRVSGLYRPLAARDAAVAAQAARPVIAELAKSTSPAIRTAAIKVATRLNLEVAGLDLLAIVSNPQAGSETRVEALKAMSTRNDARLAQAVQLALKDKSENLRKEATRLQASLKPGNATVQLRSVLERGSLGEKQNALTTLAGVAGADADAILSEHLDRLLAGKLAPELELEVLEASAKRTAPALKEKLARYESARPKKPAIAGFRECLTGGNAAEGRKIFIERVEASCVRCHKVGDDGGEVGPVLDGIGAKQTRQYLLESIVDPNAVIAPGFDSVLVVLKDGRSFAGVLKSESPTELVINSPEDGIIKVVKANIQKREKGMSAMLAELANVLSKRDLRDLVEFLSCLK